jgi:phospholipid/cholesterol/gamma-HCH transport system substrate-binding protein
MKADSDTKARILFALVLSVIAAAGAIWWFTASLRYDTYRIETRDPVSGLIADAPVEFHGVPVGRVKRVDLIDPSSVRILLSIRKDAPVTTATVATITSRGLATHGFTGYVYVSLDDEGSDRRPIVAADAGDYPVIPTAASRSVNLDLAIAQVNENVETLTRQIEATLDPKTVATLKQSAESLQRVSRALETQVLPGAQKTLTKLDDLSTTMTGAAEKLRRDPSVALRGSGKRALGPGEER